MLLNRDAVCWGVVDVLPLAVIDFVLSLIVDFLIVSQPDLFSTVGEPFLKAACKKNVDFFFKSSWVCCTEPY